MNISPPPPPSSPSTGRVRLRSLSESTQNAALILGNLSSDRDSPSDLASTLLNLRNSDSISLCMHKSNLKFQKLEHYLDFGCSSGRTVRTLELVYPEAFWHGVDPVEESIKLMISSWKDQNSFCPQYECIFLQYLLRQLLRLYLCVGLHPPFTFSQIV